MAPGVISAAFVIFSNECFISEYPAVCACVYVDSSLIIVNFGWIARAVLSLPLGSGR